LKVDEAQSTRDRILDAAANVFGEKGYRDAGVREICQAAGVNLAAVNYHFGDKASLYRQVIAHTIRQTLAGMPPIRGFEAGRTPPERLEAFIESFMGRVFSVQTRARVLRFMLREIVDPSPALGVIVEQVMRPHFDGLCDIVRGFVGDGADDAFVRRCAMSVIGQCIFYRHNSEALALLDPRLSFDEACVKRLAKHIAAFSIAAIERLAEQGEGER
jgi:AcrR family transcriptional regulator